MNHQAAGCVFPDLDSQTVLLDLEFRQVVLAHEIEDLLQLLDVDGQCVMENLRIWGFEDLRIFSRLLRQILRFIDPYILKSR